MRVALIGKSQTSCFWQTARIFSNSSGGITPPEGLLGELAMTMRVFGVITFSMVGGAQHEAVFGVVVHNHRRAASVLHDVGIADPVGRGDDDFVAGLIRQQTTLKMECLPPTLTTHSAGWYAEPNSRLCHAQMASRSGMMPGTGVYLVLFSSMALMAACLMWSGVGKVRLAGAEVGDVHALGL